MEEKVGARAIISGRVQGVCFRMETKQTADRFGVRGWVRNRHDGDVEALFEGDKDRVLAVLKWCEAGPPLAHVSAVSVDWTTYSGAFSAFEIRR
ncbi:MAG: acylphosphatase [Thermodesulfobacteriota bacterium]